MEKTVSVKVPLTNGKEATLTLEGSEVEIKTPAGFKWPKAELVSLRAALDELSAEA